MITPDEPVDGYGMVVENYRSKMTFFQPPLPIGEWIIDPNTHGPCTVFVVYAKPTDEQIKNTEQLLGWKWRDL